MSFIQVIYICWKIPQLEKERDLQCLENGFIIKTEFCFTPKKGVPADMMKEITGCCGGCCSCGCIVLLAGFFSLLFLLAAMFS